MIHPFSNHIPLPNHSLVTISFPRCREGPVRSLHTDVSFAAQNNSGEMVADESAKRCAGEEEPCMGCKFPNLRQFVARRCERLQDISALRHSTRLMTVSLPECRALSDISVRYAIGRVKFQSVKHIRVHQKNKLGARGVFVRFHGQMLCKAWQPGAFSLSGGEGGRPTRFPVSPSGCVCSSLDPVF